MRKITQFFVTLLILTFGYGVRSQTSSYSFTNLTGTFTPNSSTATNVSTVEADTSVSGVLPIGFTFVYCGVNYTDFFMSSNGTINLGATSTSTSGNNLAAANAANRPIIAPLWDDLDGNATVGGAKVSKATYQVTGTAPNRILTVEWLNWEWYWNSNDPTISFQVKLYETTNVIEFVYRDELGTPLSTAVSATIGINDPTGTGFLNVDANSTVPIVSSTTGFNAINVRPGNNVVYRFTPPTCFYTGSTTVTATSQTGTTVNLSSAAAFPIEVFVGSMPPTASTTPTATIPTGSTSVQISGLSPSINNDVYIRYTCVGSSNPTPWQYKTSFTTLCGVVNGNFFEGFENTATGTAAAPTVPLCWTYVNTSGGTAAYGTINTTAPRSGSNGYYTYRPTATNGDILLISPETNNLGSGTKQVRFWARKTSATVNPKFEIYRMSGNTATSTKTLLQSINLTATWTEYIVFLPTTTDDHFAFSFDRIVGTSPFVYVDDIYYEDMMPCAFPLNITSSAVTSNSATVSWNASLTSGVTTYEYEARSAGNATVSGTVTGTTANITGLTPGLIYEVYVRSVCGTNKGGWTTFPTTFTTLCGVVNGNFFEGFESTATGTAAAPTAPLCWTYVNGTGGTSAAGYVSTTALRSGSNGYYTTRPTATNGDILLISPETNNLGSGTKQVRFWARKTSATVNPKFEIYRMSGNTATSTKTLLQSINLTATWTEYIVFLPTTTDDYFAFSFDRIVGTSPIVYVDDIYYEDMMPCAFPLNITSSAVTSNSATVSWNASLTSGVTTYEYEARSAGNATVSGTVTGTTANITGLIPGLIYEVYVRSVCGPNKGSWTLFPVTFTTLCGVINSNFFEGFENTATGTAAAPTAPLCWTYVNGTGGTLAYGYVSTTAARTGSTNGYYTYRPTATNGDILLISPETNNLGNGTKQVRFWARKTSATVNPKFEIYRMNGKTATSTKTLLQSINLTATWTEYIVFLPTTTDDHFAFSFDRIVGTSPFVYVDDIYYEDMMPCAFPLNITSSAVTSNSATVSWNASLTSGVTTYEYEARSAGNATVSGTVTGTTTNITGLIPGLIYEVYVRSVCGTNKGAWTTFPTTFTTLCGVVNGNFFEGFESTATGTAAAPTAPLCWTYVNGTGGTLAYGYVSTTAARTGSTNGYYTYRPTAPDGDVLLISPETNNLGNGTKQVRFWAKKTSATVNPKFEIYRMNGNTATSTKTLLQSINLTTTDWTEYIVFLPTTTDDYFAFSFDRIAGNSPFVYVDDIYYEDMMPCAFPLNITSSAITTTTATISWNTSLTSGVTTYEYEARSAGNPTISGTVTGLTTTIPGLKPATPYTIYIRSVCGTNKGAWTLYPVDIHTACPVYDNFFEGFETTETGTAAAPTAPVCWTYLNTTGGTAAYGYVTTTAARTGSTKGYYTYRPSATDGDVLLISPETNNLGNGTKQVRFWARKTSATVTPKFEIYRMDGVTATSSKTLIKEVVLTDTWVEYTVALPVTTDDYFAFSFNRVGSAPFVYVDDIYYEDIPAPTLTTTQSNNICFGGNTAMASVVVKDGVQPLTYLWSPSGGTNATATGLKAGVYTVTVTDAINRSATATVTITETDKIISNFTSSNVTCNGLSNGSVTLSPTGGTAPYSYLWSNGTRTPSLSGLKAGIHQVTITDANNCTTIEDITITEPTALTTSGTQVDVSVYKGNDGSAMVVVTGGTAPYTYLWSNGGTGSTASGLIAGTYTVTVTDANGCITSLDFVITQPIPLMTESVSHKDVSCNGGADGTATIVAIGGNKPYTYQWSPTGGTQATATGLTAGTYTVVVTESTGETITESFNIKEPNLLIAKIETKTDVTCYFASNGTATITVNGGTAPYTYFWSNGMTTATANNLNAGTYNVEVADANGCKATATVIITQPTALVVTSNSTNISCYGQNDGSVSVNVSGGVGPYTYSWSNGQVGTNLNNLAKGIYVVTITDANNCAVTKSFTITEPAFVHPPVAVNQDFCIGQNATLGNVVITGSNIKWYSSANGNTQLLASTIVTNGTTYYASQTVGTCESATRTAVKITLNQGTPLTTTQLNVCSNTRVQNITIDGFNHTQLRWYSTANSTTVIPVIQMLVTGTYYVSSVTGTCESVRQVIQVTVASAVPAPTASSQVVCGNSTLNDLIVVKDPSATLRWYSSLQSMIPLANTTVVSNGTYYVQQLIGVCESIKVAVPVQVINVSAPTMTSIITCEGNTIADLHPTTGQYLWYLNSNTTTALPDTFVIIPGSYYLAYQNTGCVSNKVNVVVTVNARPASPTGQLNQSFGGSAKISDLQMNQQNVSWFATYDDAVKQLNQLAATHPLQDKATYYGILKGTNNCGSLVPTAVTVRVNLSNAELDLTQLKYYPNPVDSELNISYIEEIKKVEVFTITGQRVFGNDYQGNEVKVDLSRLSTGTYLVKIETAKASQFVKIVKK